ncbi:WhiB family transcriptional regulator [Streptomyces sp. NPDC088707]|uniref:WhiB family transcriptional regulator n=1 Tax=Streptomyces sp. NPDC088707 TaxID=3365871 RepID=UPI0037F6C647
MRRTSQVPCSAVDPNFWFPDAADVQGIADAKKVCQQCPGREACLERALSAEGRVAEGIAGGLTGDERRALIEERQLGKALPYNVGPIPPKRQRIPAAS